MLIKFFCLMLINYGIDFKKFLDLLFIIMNLIPAPRAKKFGHLLFSGCRKLAWIAWLSAAFVAWWLNLFDVGLTSVVNGILRSLHKLLQGAFRAIKILSLASLWSVKTLITVSKYLLIKLWQNLVYVAKELGPKMKACWTSARITFSAQASTLFGARNDVKLARVLAMVEF